MFKRLLYILMLYSLSVTQSWADIFDAAKTGDMREVRLYVTNGGDVNATDSSGRTPLYWASLEGHIDIAKLLVDKGAEINKENVNGNMPLHGAANR